MRGKKEFFLQVVIAILAGALALTIILGLAGKDGPQKENVNTAFTAEQLENDGTEAQDGVRRWSISHVSLPHAFEAAVTFGERVYGCYYNNAAVCVSVCDAKNGRELETHEIPGLEEILGITVAGDGEIYVVTMKDNLGTLWRLDGSGNVEKSKVQAEMAGWRYHVLGIFADGQGYRYLCYEGDDVIVDPQGNKIATEILRVYVLDHDLDYVCKTDVKKTYLTTILVGEDGVPMFFGEDGDGFYTQRIGTRQGQSFEQVRLENVMPWELERGSGYIHTQQGILFYRDGALQRFSMEQGKTEKLLDLSEAGIFEEDILSLSMKGGIVEMIDQYKGSDVSEYTKLVPGEDVQRVTVTIGVTFLNEQLREAITDYNRKQDRVTLHPVIYAEQYDSENASQRLTLDLIQGKGPDLIGVDGVDFDVLASAGAFLDLYALMDRDPQCGRDAFVESVLKAHETGGKLYELAPGFFLYSMFGGKSVVKGRSGVNVKELMEILKENGGDVNSIYGFSADEPVLTTLCALGMDEFIDWEAGTCDFTQEGFLDVLHFAKEYQGEYHESFFNAVRGKEILFVITMLGKAEDYCLWNGIFGEPVEFIGFPTDAGSGTVAYFVGGLTINAKTKHVKECWEFMKDYLECGRHENMGFPILRERLDEVLDKAMQEDYALNEIGERERIPKQSYSERNNKKATVMVYKASREEVEAVRSLIGHVSGKHAYHLDIMKIIDEEAQAYFQGQKSAGQVAAVIQSRVQLYLQENH